MKVLQLGNSNWADKYQIPDDIDWEYNDYPSKNKEKQHGYDVVVITADVQLTSKEWFDLQWLVDPYKVFFTPSLKNSANKNLRTYLKLQAAMAINQQPQDLIDDLIPKYFTGQSGLRVPVSNLALDTRNVPAYEYVDGQHMGIKVDSPDKWVNIGTYRQGLYLNPNHLIKLWLEYQSQDVQVRLRIYIQPSGFDGDVSDCHYIFLDGIREKEIPVKVSPTLRIACIGIEAHGKGRLQLGVLHSRWSRAGKGEFLTGGCRILDKEKGEDVAYYFNPGDMRPPLNVYFSGARGLEGFEAYPLFRYTHAPSLLFTDMRLEIGQFYTGSKIEGKIKEVIREKLSVLNFTNHDLIMNGISMGTYPAMRLGSQLAPYAINVAKPIANLGLVAARGRLQRPGQFTTIFDIDSRLIGSTDLESLRKLDKKFWEEFDRTNLRDTRLFISYMINDDYDNRAIMGLKASPAVKKACQFVYKGFPGRHSDAPQIVFWFVNRVNYLTRKVFERGHSFNE